MFGDTLVHGKLHSVSPVSKVNGHWRVLSSIFLLFPLVWCWIVFCQCTCMSVRSLSLTHTAPLDIISCVLLFVPLSPTYTHTHTLSPPEHILFCHCFSLSPPLPLPPSYVLCSCWYINVLCCKYSYTHSHLCTHTQQESVSPAWTIFHH